MRKVNIHEAKTTLSQLVELAEAGEDVLIARAGRVVARLTSAHVKRGGIKIGGHKGVFKRVSRDFDERLPPAVLAEFMGHSLNVEEHLSRKTKKKN